MLIFLDVVKDKNLRQIVQTRLAHVGKDTGYSFPDTFPILHRYRPLSKYSIDDVIKSEVCATSIGEFNDFFDGAIHRFGTEEEITSAAKNEVDKQEALQEEIGIISTPEAHDSLMTTYKNYFAEDSRLKFRELENQGTFVTCFSASSDSTLMWAHYADSNKGICISYDFNQLPLDDLKRLLIFPVAYSSSPVYLSDLLNDKVRKICPYPIDTAVLCAALNKADVWCEEKEWRLVFVLNSMRNKTQRIPVPLPFNPVRICFGYHFLKPLFYFDNDDKEACIAKMQEMLYLLDYIIQNNIPTSVMAPDVGYFHQRPKPISGTVIKDFILRNIYDTSPKNKRYYDIIHDKLIDCLEGEKPHV